MFVCTNFKAYYSWLLYIATYVWMGFSLLYNCISFIHIYCGMKPDINVWLWALTQTPVLCEQLKRNQSSYLGTKNGLWFKSHNTPITTDVCISQGPATKGPAAEGVTWHRGVKRTALAVLSVHHGSLTKAELTKNRWNETIQVYVWQLLATVVLTQLQNKTSIWSIKPTVLCPTPLLKRLHINEW